MITKRQRANAITEIAEMLDDHAMDRMFKPYCAQKRPDGKYILLNRHYKPIGCLCGGTTVNYGRGSLHRVPPQDGSRRAQRRHSAAVRRHCCPPPTRRTRRPARS